MKQIKPKNSKLILVVFLFSLAINIITVVEANAATINVGSFPALQMAIDKATKGDIIILNDGVYYENYLTIGTNGITVKSATLGGVFLNGTDAIIISGSNITFSGFQFTSNTTITGSPIIVSGNSNTLTQLNFNGYSADHMVYITGSNNIVSFSNFQNKPAILCNKCGTGDLVQIIPNSNNPGYNKIQYCSFQHLPGLGGDFGNECIRIGNGSTAAYISRTIVEYCYFEDTGLGDSETISIKSQENMIRYCTFKNQQDAMLCFRNGDNNVAYGNFFINSGGIRVKEANNIFCYNNYFEKSGIGSSADAVTFVYDISTYPVVLKNINFIHNTFYNCGDIDLGGTGATNNIWANNIFKKTSGNIFKNVNKGTTWVGNIYQGTLGITITSGIIKSDPLLITNSDGYKGLSAGSPAINAASSSYPDILDIPVIDDDPTLLFDVGRKSRPTTITLKDVGSDEFTSGATTNHPLLVTEVGPSYLGGPSLSVNPNELLDKKNTILIFPNPAKTSFTLETSAIAGVLVKVAVYNLNGQLVKSNEDFQKQAFISQNKQYDVSDLNNGIYFVKVVSESDSKTMKLIIKK